MLAAWRAQVRQYGDPALWDQGGHYPIDVDIVPDPEPTVLATGGSHVTRQAVLVCKSDLNQRPVNGESVEVLDGQLKGTWTVEQVVGSAGVAWRVAVK